VYIERFKQSAHTVCELCRAARKDGKRQELTLQS
jgi:hypothetical protein